MYFRVLASSDNCSLKKSSIFSGNFCCSCIVMVPTLVSLLVASFNDSLKFLPAVVLIPFFP